MLREAALLNNPCRLQHFLDQVAGLIGSFASVLRHHAIISGVLRLQIGSLDMDHAVAGSLIELVGHLRIDVDESAVAFSPFVYRLVEDGAVGVKARINYLALHILETYNLTAGAHVTCPGCEQRKACLLSHVLLCYYLSQDSVIVEGQVRQFTLRAHFLRGLTCIRKRVVE